LPSTTATSAVPAGSPRESLSVPRQREDYSTVIGWAVEQSNIDSRQIIAWGTSFAGMHVLELAVADTRLVAAVAQAPLTDGLAAARMSDPKVGIRLFGLALLDRVGSLFGASQSTSPATQNPEACPSVLHRTDRSERSS
jgi:uncharacterized protein